MNVITLRDIQMPVLPRQSGTLSGTVRHCGPWF